MLEQIIHYSIRNKFIVILFALGLVGFGLYSLFNIPIGTVPDVTNNQVQIITTSRNLSTEDVEKFLTYPVELEIANVPGVKEIRSISKFGLSVVTVVFEDDMDTYLCRQLISEKIPSISENIPKGFGRPFMGPISTGLGEIYQYVIEVDPAYKNKYSLSDIRTIQDWVVRRYLSGIPGVVEINTWGGYLKQYEVSVNPERLRSLKVSLSEVFMALEKNNSVVGGGYIEKNKEAYFIRGEGLVNSLKDIENIIVTNRGGTPIFIRDLAKVGFGHATRFGAITGNGEGEKVLGQVMMLKGADSKKVIESVKKRVDEIKTLLPKGISINPFLERSELIGKTTFTIAENLILGCLIVIFVVVILLGNFRSGLIVASVIPLCLLFAISLMYIFGVDANLMSLGAIDFGIIIDGAVIIVEYITFRVMQERGALSVLRGEERQSLIDKITFRGANRMMHSAVFGQLIIIIVFIPIFSLVGVEGKMFKPMAMVFCFALIGAMIFCFTYVPVMASLFIKPTKVEKKTFSSRFISFLEKYYQPIVVWALRRKKSILLCVILIFGGIVFLFSRMGGEFVPTLDEGDFVIQPVLKTGTSLEETVKTTTQIENILKTFPEVQQVVSRIGAAEVPTDPMSMEESDIIIRLKPKGEWTSAESKDDLAEKFKEALTTQIPGVEFEFTQPIEMRFNELITGVKADVAVKIFGEDLNVLHKKALEIKRAIEHVEGASDISVEKIEGLPQMSIKYDRQKIAKYGLNIEDLNNIIESGFAGKTAGMILEGEKKFDLVLRFDESHRKNIEDIKTASILLPDGTSLPLSEFADISYTKGPAKISRDNTKRRIVVGINVRNRDLKSVVKDIQKIVNRDIKIPTGYFVEYGGQYENLERATSRLLVAVPIALLLIFILLYFAFHSVKTALMIYSAIPLSAVGGVVFLFIRDLPFSISAGVGFIALFGIAVLNGIVLIEEFNKLKEEGMDDINQRILTGSKNRLRPVLLTAMSAALGFLPMAISTSSGAEVQRPLATVVIGGLISATLLTLVVLPILYALVEEKSFSFSKKNKSFFFLILMGTLSLPFTSQAQPKTEKISLEEAIQIAIQNNSELKAYSEKVYQEKQLVKSAFNIPKTQLYYNYDKTSAPTFNAQPFDIFGIAQTINFPTVYIAQKKVLRDKVTLASNQYQTKERLLRKEVSKAYWEAVYWKQLLKGYTRLDSLYSQFSYAAKRKFEQGESNRLEQLTAQTKSKEITIKRNQINEKIRQAQKLLNSWIQSDNQYEVNTDKLQILSVDSLDLETHPEMEYLRNMQNMAQHTFSLEKKKLLPDLQLDVFQGFSPEDKAKNYLGFQVGVAVPIFFGANKAMIKATKIDKSIIANETVNREKRLTVKYESLLSELSQYKYNIDYYESTGKGLKEELLFYAGQAFSNGEIDFLQYVRLLEDAQSIEENYVTALFQYDLATLEINYITNQ